MEFKKSLILSFAFLSLTIFCPPLLAENSSGPFSEFNEKSYTELIETERQIREQLGMDPANAELYYKLSEVYTVLFDRTRKKSAQSSEWLFKSSGALEKAVMLKPDHKVALYNLGVIYKRQGKMERAREELRRAIRACDPETDDYLLLAIWMQIGMIYEEQGFYDAAKEAYEQALDYDYGNVGVRNALLDLKDRKAAARSAGSPSSYQISPGMPIAPIGPAYDPMTGAGTQPQGGLEQALPALGSMFSQRASGPQNGQEQNDWN